MNGDAANDYVQRHWLLAKNVETTDVPPHGVVRINSMDSNGVFMVVFPTEDSNPYGLAFASPNGITAGNYGQVTIVTAVPYWAHVVICEGSGVDTSECDDGTDLPSLTGAARYCGPRKGTFGLHTDQTGFRCLTDGDIDDSRAVLVMLSPLVPLFAEITEAPSTGSGSGSGSSGSGSGSGECMRDKDGSGSGTTMCPCGWAWEQRISDGCGLWLTPISPQTGTTKRTPAYPTDFKQGGTLTVGQIVQLWPDGRGQSFIAITAKSGNRKRVELVTNVCLVKGDTGSGSGSGVGGD